MSTESVKASAYATELEETVLLQENASDSEFRRPLDPQTYRFI